MKLVDNQMCAVCGKRNKWGLGLDFRLDGNILRTEFKPGEIHQGFENIVHGGIISLILDETMGNLLWRLGIYAVTAELTVKLVRPAVVGQKLLFEGNIRERRKKIIYTEAAARLDNGLVVAKASAKFIKVDYERYKKESNTR